MEPGRPVGGTYYLYRTLRNLDLDNMLEKLMNAANTKVDGGLTALEERLERDEFETRIDHLKKEIEAEIRRRLVADRGVDAMAKTLRKPLPEDVDFMHATRDEMASLRKALYPLRAGWPFGWRGNAVTVARARSTSAAPSATRFPTEACPPTRSSGFPAPRSRRSSSSPTSPAPSRPSPASR